MPTYQVTGTSHDHPGTLPAGLTVEQVSVLPLRIEVGRPYYCTLRVEESVHDDTLAYLDIYPGTSIHLDKAQVDQLIDALTELRGDRAALAGEAPSQAPLAVGRTWVDGTGDRLKLRYRGPCGEPLSIRIADGDESKTFWCSPSAWQEIKAFGDAAMERGTQ